MNLKNFNTCELMRELSTREGVEMICVEIGGFCNVSVASPDRKIYTHKIDYFYDEKRDGPEVILRIID